MATADRHALALCALLLAVAPPAAQDNAAAPDSFDLPEAARAARAADTTAPAGGGSASIPDEPSTAPAPETDSAAPDDTSLGPVEPEEDAEAPVEETPVAGSGRPRVLDPLNASAVGLRLSYFYYHELFPLQEVIEDFGVDRIDGEPKSAEHGLCEGLYLEMVRRLPHAEVFVRPKLGAFLGLLHQYDGSTQAEIWNDSGEWVAEFRPADGVKNNYFLNLGMDIGTGLLRPVRGLALWTGISGSLWKRSLWGDAEYYYWFDLPLGVWGYTSAGSRWLLGLEVSVDFMLGGWMKIFLGAEPGEQAPDIPAVRLSDGVPFGRRASLNVALPFEVRAGRTAGVRFVPWFEYYHFEKSNEECLDGDCGQAGGRWFYEPASRTFIWGLGTDIVIHRGQRR